MCGRIIRCEKIESVKTDIFRFRHHFAERFDAQRKSETVVLHQRALLCRMSRIENKYQGAVMSTIHNPETFTYEQLMAMFRRTDEKIAELRELQKETTLAMKETDRRIKEANQRHGKLSDRIGDLIQAMVYGGIKRLFRDLGYDFDVINQKYHFGNKVLGIYGEVDLFLENGELALLVEVKTNLSVDDVKEHQECLENFRLVSDAKNDKRRFIAAVGGGLVQENVRIFALKQGMFVIQQSGENVEILAPEGKPMVW